MWDGLAKIGWDYGGIDENCVTSYLKTSIYR